VAEDCGPDAGGGAVAEDRGPDTGGGTGAADRGPEIRGGAAAGDCGPLTAGGAAAADGRPETGGGEAAERDTRPDGGVDAGSGVAGVESAAGGRAPECGVVMDGGTTLASVSGRGGVAAGCASVAAGFRDSLPRSRARAGGGVAEPSP
jgi:hypothetical protein